MKKEKSNFLRSTRCYKKLNDFWDEFVLQNKQTCIASYQSSVDPFTQRQFLWQRKKSRSLIINQSINQWLAKEKDDFAQMVWVNIYIYTPHCWSWDLRQGNGVCTELDVISIHVEVEMFIGEHFCWTVGRVCDLNFFAPIALNGTFVRAKFGIFSLGPNKFLARTIFVLESLPKTKNPGQDFWRFCLRK